MHSFFTPELTEAAGLVPLPPDEAHHALNVLRLRDGDELRLINGRGLVALSRLRPSGKKHAAAEVLSVEQVPKPLPAVSVFLGMLKNRQRMEWAVEKLTELGVYRILIGETERTERQKLRTDRLEALALSAAKQSLSAWIPQIELVPFQDTLIAAASAGESLLPVLAHEKLVRADGFSSQSFLEIWDDAKLKPLVEILLLIGPEGGFSGEEVAAAQALPRMKLLHLGPQRLRAETAALVCAGLFCCGNGQV